MKKIKMLISLFVFAALLSPVLASAQPGGYGAGTTPKFNNAKFVAEINKNFKDKAMGYQVILLKNGQVVEKVADGVARNVADGAVKMTIDTPANIGSTVKFFAATALLHELQKQGVSLNFRLKTEVYHYFPKVWQDNMHPSIKKITFRDLLQHKSGFVHNDPDAKVFFDYLKKGVSSDQSKTFAYGKRKYANANITAIGYVLAAISNPKFLPEFNKDVVATGISDRPEHQNIEGGLGIAFENYMKTRIFNKITPAILPSCDAPNEYPKRNIVYAKMYTFVSDLVKGGEFSSKAGSGQCHAAGGWYISGRELAAYVANYAATDTIVSAATREMMFDDDAPQNQLVWSMNIEDGDLLKNFDWNTSPYMGGDYGGAHATIVKLPAGYYAVGIVNSHIFNDKGESGGSYLLTLNIIEAFNAGFAENF